MDSKLADKRLLKGFWGFGVLGFCYVNDVVLAVERLQGHGLDRVLVVDLDIHHGDGTEEAFYYSSSVYTISFHKWARGYFPGTGAPKCVGQGPGRYTNLNVPVLDGIVDEQYTVLVSTIVTAAAQRFDPHCIVVVCGVDTLST